MPDVVSRPLTRAARRRAEESQRRATQERQRGEDEAALRAAMEDTSMDHDDDPMNVPRANDMPVTRNTSTDTDNAEVADVRVAADDHAARNDDCGVKTTEVPKTTDATTTR
ncbi:hypothetical protein PR001_g29885, partial [Phytophthora rubi]